jgi:hypothetical protein
LEQGVKELFGARTVRRGHAAEGTVRGRTVCLGNRPQAVWVNGGGGRLRVQRRSSGLTHFLSLHPDFSASRMSFGFVQPWMLVGLAGIALPIIAHLLSKRKFDIVFWGAMQFLELGRKTRRRIRLEELLLLLLRIGLIAIIALAFARPWGKGGAFNALTEGVRRDVAYVIDGSYSMGWTGGDKTPQAAARQWVQKSLGTLRTGDTVSVWEAREQVLPRVETGTSDIQVAREEIDRLAPSAGASRLAAAMTRAVQQLSQGTNPVRELIVVTDGQDFPWMSADSTLWARFDDLCSQQTIKPRIWAVDVSDRAAKDMTNFAVDRVQLSRQMTVPNFPVRIRTTVRQFGGESTKRPVYLSINGQRLQDKTTVVSLPPDGEAPLEFEQRFDTAGTYLVSVGIDDDQLPGDNTSHAVVTVAAAVPVLLVDGKPSLDPVQSKSYFVEAALGGAGPDSAWVRTTTVSPSDLTAAKLEGRDAVVLLDVADLDAGQVKSLEAFVSQGGGLVIAPGPAARPDFYAQLLGRDGKGLLPAALVAQQSTKGVFGGPTVIEPESLSVPWLLRFKPGTGVDLATVRFSQWWKLAPYQEPQQPIAEGAAAPASGVAISSPVVAAKFKAGDPWLVTRRYGQGQVAVLATPLDPEWSTLPSKNDFVPLLHELVFSMTSRGQGRVVETGSPLELQLGRGVSAESIRFRLPDGTEAAAEAGGTDAKPSARLKTTTLPGVYQAVRASRPQDAPEYFVVDFDRAESNLTPLDDAGRERLTAKDRLKFIRDVDEWTEAVEADSPRAEVWWMALLAVLGLLVFEVAMTRRLVRSGHGVLDVEAEPVEA